MLNKTCNVEKSSSDSSFINCRRGFARPPNSLRYYGPLIHFPQRKMPTSFDSSQRDLHEKFIKIGIAVPNKSWVAIFAVVEELTSLPWTRLKSTWSHGTKPNFWRLNPEKNHHLRKPLHRSSVENNGEKNQKWLHRTVMKSNANSIKPNETINFKGLDLQKKTNSLLSTPPRRPKSSRRRWRRLTSDEAGVGGNESGGGGGDETDDRFHGALETTGVHLRCDAGVAVWSDGGGGLVPPPPPPPLPPAVGKKKFLCGPLHRPTISKCDPPATTLDRFGLLPFDRRRRPARRLFVLLFQCSNRRINFKKKTPSWFQLLKATSGKVETTKPLLFIFIDFLCPTYSLEEWLNL